MQTGRKDKTLGREECLGRLLAIQLAFPGRGFGKDKEILDFPETPESPEAIPVPNPDLRTKMPRRERDDLRRNKFESNCSTTLRRILSWW